MSRAARRFHHTGQNLERRGLARTVWTDHAEDLSWIYCEANAANRFVRAIILVQISHLNRRRRTIRIRRTQWLRFCSVEFSRVHMAWTVPYFLLLSDGQLPWINISPSAGIPGFASPIAPFN